MERFSNIKVNPEFTDLALDDYYDLHVAPNDKLNKYGYGRNPTEDERRQHFERTHYFRSGYQPQPLRSGIQRVCIKNSQVLKMKSLKPIETKLTSSFTGCIKSLHKELEDKSKELTQKKATLTQALLPVDLPPQTAGVVETVKTFKTATTVETYETVEAFGTVGAVEAFGTVGTVAAIETLNTLQTIKSLSTIFENEAMDLDEELESQMEFQLSMDLEKATREPVVVKIGDEVIYDERECELLDI